MIDQNDQDDEMLVRQLAQFRPQPSQRFYAKEDSMPWMTEQLAEPRRRWAHVARPWVGAALMALIIACVAAATLLAPPPVTTLAHSVMTLLMAQPKDVATKHALGIPDSTDDWINNLTIADVQQRSGAAVWEPSTLPVGYKLTNVSYLPTEKVVMSVYEYAALPSERFRYDQSPSIVLVQHPRADADADGEAKVGASAAIEHVSIGNTQGEYVQGAWTSSSSASETLEWEANACCRMLRWQQNDVVLTLNSYNVQDQPGFVSRDDMIALAAQIAVAP